MKDHLPHPQALLGVFAPLACLPPLALTSLATPYGPVEFGTAANLVWFGPASALARVYAAKVLGLTQLVELLPLQGINHLLAPGDLVVPHDLCDLTTGSPTTFFGGKGYGFLPQTSPFCPGLRFALLAAARSAVAKLPLPSRPRVFSRATLALLNEAAPLDPSTEVNLLTTWAADAFHITAAPVNFLARELEICYVPLGYLSHEVTPLALLPTILRATPTFMSNERACPCAQAMQPARAQGLVGENWPTWLPET